MDPGGQVDGQYLLVLAQRHWWANARAVGSADDTGQRWLVGASWAADGTRLSRCARQKETESGSFRKKL